MPPMQVAKYLYRVTLMPAASAVAGFFTHRARRLSPCFVLLRNTAEIIAMIIARYTIKP